ncbi:MAG: hypothetical protein WBY47_16550, partial [Desulfobacterales bacterium]
YTFNLISGSCGDLLLILVSRHKKFKSNLKPRQAFRAVAVSDPIRDLRFDFVKFSTSYMAWMHHLSRRFVSETQ